MSERASARKSALHWMRLAAQMFRQIPSPPQLFEAAMGSPGRWTSQGGLLVSVDPRAFLFGNGGRRLVAGEAHADPVIARLGALRLDAERRLFARREP